MYPFVLAAGAGIAAVCGGLYVYLTRLVFQVKVLHTRRQTKFIAHEEEQLIGTIEVSLPDNFNARKLNELFPKPDSYKFEREDESGIKIEIGAGAVTENLGDDDRRKLVIYLYASLKKAGTYKLTPIFKYKHKVDFSGTSTSIQFKVLPSTPYSLTVWKVKRQDIHFGKQTAEHILYKGGMAQLFVRVYDRFGNVRKDEFNAEVESEFVDITSCDFDYDCHVVTVHCHKEGETTLNLKFGERIKVRYKRIDVHNNELPKRLKYRTQSSGTAKDI